MLIKNNIHLMDCLNIKKIYGCLGRNKDINCDSCFVRKKNIDSEIKLFDHLDVKFFDNPSDCFNKNPLCKNCSQNIRELQNANKDVTEQSNIKIAKIWKKYYFFCDNKCYNNWVEQFNK